MLSFHFLFVPSFHRRESFFFCFWHLLPPPKKFPDAAETERTLFTLTQSGNPVHTTHLISSNFVEHIIGHTQARANFNTDLKQILREYLNCPSLQNGPRLTFQAGRINENVGKTEVDLRKISPKFWLDKRRKN